MEKLKPYSSTFLAFAGFLLIGMGLYFMFMRPALLPEDLRYMNTTLTDLDDTLPGLQVWLKKVFWVLGGYIFATGVLTFYISRTTFRARTKGAFATVIITGITSIGFMIAVNFMLNSDFKWVLLVFGLFWVIALILYRFRK
jgi:hypothetical protein